MQTRKLPIGIQNLAEMITQGYYYVDKTPFVAQLIDQGKYYFLSRPRRFGKSLLLDTIKELFEGNRVLFSDLYIHDKWDWKKTHPVIRLSFGSGALQTRAELNKRIDSLLRSNYARLALPLDEREDAAGQFSELIRLAAQKYAAKVVLLIDEYDKPILDNIADSAAATVMREGLKNLYSVVKDADPYIQFCLFTGVSKFSKVSLFSGLNNLNDVTLDEQYSAICGYTDKDIDTVFAPEVAGLDRNQIREWYNGYNWTGEPVYNPFDVLLLFSKREFRAYWFETGTPTFLIELLRKREFFTPDLASTQSDSDLLSKFDVDDIGTEALLFQAGYLTIARTEERFDKKMIYWLGFPNQEVRCSLSEALITQLGVSRPFALKNSSAILHALYDKNVEKLAQHLKSLYASIPYEWHTQNKIANYEGYYASIFYSHFAALGLHVVVEDSCSTGKVDMTIVFNRCVFMFEFKVVADKPTGHALQQIKHKNYAQKYQKPEHTLYLIGVEFSKAARQIVAFEVEEG
jgi:hypothetical protein